MPSISSLILEYLRGKVHFTGEQNFSDFVLAKPPLLRLFYLSATRLDLRAASRADHFGEVHPPYLGRLDLVTTLRTGRVHGSENLILMKLLAAYHLTIFSRARVDHA